MADGNLKGPDAVKVLHWIEKGQIDLLEKDLSKLPAEAVTDWAEMLTTDVRSQIVAALPPESELLKLISPPPTMAPIPPIPSGATAYYSTATSELFEASEGKDIFIFDASQLGGDDEIRGFNPAEDEIWVMNGGFSVSSWQDNSSSKIHYESTTEQTGSVFVPGAQLWDFESHDAIRFVAVGIDVYL